MNSNLTDDLEKKIEEEFKKNSNFKHELFYIFRLLSHFDLHAAMEFVEQVKHVPNDFDDTSFLENNDNFQRLKKRGEFYKKNKDEFIGLEDLKVNLEQEILELVSKVWRELFDAVYDHKGLINWSACELSIRDLNTAPDENALGFTALYDTPVNQTVNIRNHLVVMFDRLDAISDCEWYNSPFYSTFMITVDKLLQEIYGKK